jgi:hydrogenase maturation protease
MARTLIAGFGNVLRGDDGFGVEVIRRLQRADLGTGIELLDVGTGGFRLPQALLSGYDRLVVVDAVRRGGAPGSVYVLEVDDVTATPVVDMHLAVPARALGLAKALGALPARVFLVGCEPAVVDELSTALSTAVDAAADVAVRRIADLLAADPSHG